MTLKEFMRVINKLVDENPDCLDFSVKIYDDDSSQCYTLEEVSLAETTPSKNRTFAYSILSRSDELNNSVILY